MHRSTVVPETFGTNKIRKDAMLASNGSIAAPHVDAHLLSISIDSSGVAEDKPKDSDVDALLVSISIDSSGVAEDKPKDCDGCSIIMENKTVSNLEGSKFTCFGT